MDRNDLVVEVRDINLTRLGALTPEDYTLEATPIHNGVGGWKLTLPADHPRVADLRTPGSGIVVTGPDDVFISGPTTSPESAVSSTDLGGTVTFAGISDDTILFDRLAYADPAHDEASQATDYDVRTGPSETVMHGYVNANVGPGALTARRASRLTMGENHGLGSTVTKSARFDNLGELTAGIANAADLRQRVVQRGDGLVYETSAIVDRSKTIRLDTSNGTLAGYRLAVSVPGVTHAIVGSADATYDRVFAAVTTTDSADASTAWGRRIERFVNQAYEVDVNAWTQSARELLADEGNTVTSVQAIPGDDTSMRFGADWNIGDKVTVVADGREYVAIVTGAVLKVGTSGIQVGAVLGDVTAFNERLAVTAKVNALASRVSYVERTLQTTVATGGGSTETDTGWLALPYTVGSTFADFGTFGGIAYERGQYKKVGNTVKVRGTITRTTGSATTICTFGIGFRPPRAVVRPAIFNTTAGGVIVRADGAFLINATLVNGQTLSFEFEYDIDEL